MKSQQFRPHGQRPHRSRSALIPVDASGNDQFHPVIQLPSVHSNHGAINVGKNPEHQAAQSDGILQRLPRRIPLPHSLRQTRVPRVGRPGDTIALRGALFQLHPQKAQWRARNLAEAQPRSNLPCKFSDLPQFLHRKSPRGPAQAVLPRIAAFTSPEIIPRMSALSESKSNAMCLQNGHDDVPSENYVSQRLAAGPPLGVERKARRCCSTAASNESRSLRPVLGNVQLIFLIAAIRNCRIIRSYTGGFRQRTNSCEVRFVILSGVIRRLCFSPLSCGASGHAFLLENEKESKCL
jgi:hypothetical protein